MDRPLRFDPNTGEHLEWALKTAYLYFCGDDGITLNEANNAVVDALCNLIGDSAFCDWVEGGDFEGF